MPAFCVGKLFVRRVTPNTLSIESAFTHFCVQGICIYPSEEIALAQKAQKMETIYDGLSDSKVQTRRRLCVCSQLKTELKSKFHRDRSIRIALKILIVSLLITSNPPKIKAQCQQDFSLENRDSDILLKNEYNFDVPILLMAAGVGVTFFDNSLHNIKELNYPSFDHSYDDYTQYLPAALMLSLKTFGVKSRSTWGQMLVSDAFGIAITTISVNALKYTISRSRPDNSANNSFPSGHTATAFMTATMLHKEYGHKSPWYSVGAYTCASITGVTRILNNRHWMGDVVVGAGIGVLSVELGYLLGDIIFKKSRSTSFFTPPNTKNRNPTFVAVKMGQRSDLSDYTLDGGESLKIEHGSYLGIEGAWYLHKRFGIGGQVGMSAYQYNLDNLSTPSLYGAYTLNLGLYNSQPIASCFRIENKILFGKDLQQEESELDGLVSVNNNINYTFGTSFAYWAKDNFQLKIYCDYIVCPNFIGSNIGQEISTGISMAYMFN